MPNCPNCGRVAERTGDWACQWCGYPLLSNSYKKIPRTYRQLKGDRLLKQKPLVVERPKPLPEPAPGPVLKTEPAPALEAKAEPVPKVKPPPALKPESETVLRAKAEPVPKVEPQPAPKSKPEPVLEAKPEPAPEPKPEPAPVQMAPIEVTVEELVSAYETNSVAADARFTNRVLKTTGVVGRIEVKDVLGIYYITLTSAQKKLLQSVRCNFTRQYSIELKQLVSGQTVTVQGKFVGSIIDISLTDCILVA